MNCSGTLLCCSLLIFLSGCSSQTNTRSDSIPKSQSQSDAPSRKPVIPSCKEDGRIFVIRNAHDTVISIPVEIVDTESGRNLGLMYRDQLSDTCGMFFIFEREQRVSFYMKNTILSLDMFFIKGDGKLITVHEYTTPFDEGSYPASELCRFVLETTAGFRARHGIKLGDRITYRLK